MIFITCSECDHGHLVGSRSILSFTNTDQGPIATVECPRGHVVLTDFGRTPGRPAIATPAPAAVAATRRDVCDAAA